MKNNLIITIIFLLISINMRAQWIDKSNTLPKDWIWASGISASDSMNAVIYLRPNLYKTANGGSTWEQIEYNSETDGEATDISMVDINNVFFCTENGKIFKIENGFQNVTLQYTDTLYKPFMNYIEMFDAENGVAMGDAPTPSTPIRILKTTNGGKNWNVVENNIIGLKSGDGWRRIDFIDMNDGYFFSSGNGKPDQKLFKTTDGGSFWDTIAKPFPLIDVMKFFDKNIGLASFQYSNYNYQTLDGGQTWDSVKAYFDGRALDIEYIPKSLQNVWLTDYYNLYFSSDTGSSWVKVNIVDTTLRGVDIHFVDEKVGWLLCGNGKVYRTTNGGGIITSVNESNNLSTFFHLEQNYPNPFNPETVISYQLPEGGHVTLKIYDVLGRELAILADEYKQPGSYSYQLSTNNIPLSSGLYFYKLATSKGSITKKMLLIK